MSSTDPQIKLNVPSINVTRDDQQSQHTFQTYQNDLIGVGILSLGNRETGKWLPQGFWYSSKTFGQNKVFCILCNDKDQSPDVKRSRVVPLSRLQASPTIKSLRLTRLISKKDESSLRNLIYSTASSGAVPPQKIITTILTKFVNCEKGLDCDVEDVSGNTSHQNHNVLDQIDKNIQRIRSHVLNLHDKSVPSDSSCDVQNGNDFSVTTEIFEPDTLGNVEKFEKDFFVEIYTFFK